MSEHPIGHRPIDWGAVSVVASILGTIGLGMMGYGILSEKVRAVEVAIADGVNADRVHSEDIARIREDRTIERALADLKTEVLLLRQEVTQSNDKKRK